MHTTIFLKTIRLRGRIRVYAHIRAIVAVTGGKLTTFNFPCLLSVNYCFVMTHLRSGKKVSYLSSGHVNPGPVPSRRGLLEDSLYRAIWVACLSCAPRAWGHRNVPRTPSTGSEYVLTTYAALNARTPLEG
jgi:hypothetical protein